eukprot:scaffold167038_cov35-Tisochrysis_lutea.AAC.2
MPSHAVQATRAISADITKYGARLYELLENHGEIKARASYRCPQSVASTVSNFLMSRCHQCTNTRARAGFSIPRLGPKPRRRRHAEEPQQARRVGYGGGRVLDKKAEVTGRR